MCLGLSELFPEVTEDVLLAASPSAGFWAGSSKVGDWGSEVMLTSDWASAAGVGFAGVSAEVSTVGVGFEGFVGLLSLGSRRGRRSLDLACFLPFLGVFDGVPAAGGASQAPRQP